MCQRLAVMQQGRIVDTLDSELLRTGGATHPYTRSLLAASRSYQREPA
jgi:peptide/nickel transport system ATP-binding protein